MIHKRAPLVDSLLSYVSTAKIPFHMPGHKQGRSTDLIFAEMAKGLLAFDLTEVPGLDNLHAPRDVIREAQELAAKAFQADRSFFLVNGTTCGIQALILALCRPGDELIMPRHVHISALEGVILSGAKPVFFTAPTHPDGFPLAVTRELLVQALEEHPQARGVLLVNPTYYGISSDLQGLVDLCHSYGKVVLVDEAHGAHFSFHPRLPQGAMEAGADACVQSTHKLLGALTQAAMLHLQGSGLDPARVQAAVSLVQSTSPSYLLMASLDGARRQMALEGEKILSGVVALAEEARLKLNRVPGIHVLTGEDLTPPSCLDPLKLLINVSGLGITGYEGNEFLAREYGIQLEMADFKNMLAMYSIGTTPEDSRALIQGIEAMARRRGPEAKKIHGLPPLPPLPPQVLLPREAWFAPAEEISLEDARGRIGARAITPYPPGIPILCPGEEITGEIINYLHTLKEKGVLGEPGEPLKIFVVEN